MAMPRISIITPSFNQGLFIEQSICSVLDQGYDDLQHIVVDAGSTDQSRPVIDLYNNDITYIDAGPCASPAQAINVGLQHADGEILGVLFADDIYLPGALHELGKAYRRLDRPDWMVGRVTCIDERDRLTGQIEPASPRSLASFLMHDSGVLPAISSFWKRSLHDRIGLFDDQLTFAYDYDFWCRLLAGGFSPAVVSLPLAARREHDASASAVSPIAAGKEYVSVARRYGSHLPMSQRYTLWMNCDQRERILVMAQAEAQGDHARRYLLQQVLRRPWWLTSHSLRHALIHGMHSADTLTLTTPQPRAA